MCMRMWSKQDEETEGGRERTCANKNNLTPSIYRKSKHCTVVSKAGKRETQPAASGGGGGGWLGLGKESECTSKVEVGKEDEWKEQKVKRRSIHPLSQYFTVFSLVRAWSLFCLTVFLSM